MGDNTAVYISRREKNDQKHLLFIRKDLTLMKEEICERK